MADEDHLHDAVTDLWPTLEDAIDEVKVVAGHARAFYGDRLKSVWLYGSRARGDSKADSDLDVLLVREAPPDLDRKQEIRDLYDPTFREIVEKRMGDFSSAISGRSRSDQPDRNRWRPGTRCSSEVSAKTRSVFYDSLFF